jgi:nucleosome binding factor SPN SPT16 subunit
VPYHKLSFKGTPFKHMVTLSPTTHALVNLMEMPFFVVSLDDVEHIHFERVDFRISKNFDMVIIKKSHMEIGTAEIPQRIGAISMLDLDTIKTWIDEKGDLTFTFGVSALNWKGVMAGVHEELRRGVFWLNEDEDGEKKDIGWKFLSMDGDEADEDEEEDESDYQESAESSAEEEEEEDSDDDVEFDESSSDGEGELGSDEEEGMDWDEMEKQAARSDKKKSYAREDRDEERRMKKKKGRR